MNGRHDRDTQIVILAADPDTHAPVLRKTRIPLLALFGEKDTLVPPATIANARAEYRLRRITLFAYAHNVFDKFAFVERDATTAVLEDPREVAVGIESRF